MKTLLHVGCGPCNIAQLPSYFQDGSWDEIRYDIDEGVEPDIVGSLLDLSLIEDGSIDAIYSSHNIEHVSSFEVPLALAEFARVLRAGGFALISCPDMLSVAEAIVAGHLAEPLYVSPAGPIAALDIIYGHQQAIERGNHFMAHKTAFTARTLGEALVLSGFQGAVVARDRLFGLHALATKSSWDTESINTLWEAIRPVGDNMIAAYDFGCYAQLSR